MPQYSKIMIFTYEQITIFEYCIYMTKRVPLHPKNIYMTKRVPLHPKNGTIEIVHAK